jgi:hypothetical protein
LRVIFFNPTKKTVQDLLDRAEACERLADGTGSDATRETMRYLASRWQTLAAEEEAKTKRRVPPAAVG